MTFEAAHESRERLLRDKNVEYVNMVAPLCSMCQFRGDCTGLTQEQAQVCDDRWRLKYQPKRPTPPIDPRD